MTEIEQKLLQKTFVRFLVDEVFNTITEDDILRIQNNRWTYKGQELTEPQIKALKVEAEKFNKSKLWEILRSELKWQANRRLIEKAENESDIIACKVLGYLTDVIDSKLTSMCK